MLAQDLPGTLQIHVLPTKRPRCPLPRSLVSLRQSVAEATDSKLSRSLPHTYRKSRLPTRGRLQLACNAFSGARLSTPPPQLGRTAHRNPAVLSQKRGRSALPQTVPHNHLRSACLFLRGRVRFLVRRSLTSRFILLGSSLGDELHPDDLGAVRRILRLGRRRRC